MPLKLFSVAGLIIAVLALHACARLPSSQATLPASKTHNQAAQIQLQNSLSASQPQGELSAYTAADGIELRWRKPAGFPSQQVQLLRRASQSRSVPRVITSARTQQGVFRDRSARRGQKYVYFIRVVDAQNKRLWQSANRVVRVAQTTPPQHKVQAGIRKASEIKATAPLQSGGPVISDIRLIGDAIALQWSAEADKKVAGWIVYRLVQGIDEQFQILARTRRRENHFIDMNRVQGKLPAYMIGAIDVEGNEITRSAARTAGSFARQRNIPAAFSLTVNTVNVKQPMLKWQPLATNEIRGYLVFRRAASTDDWATISPLLITHQYLDRSVDAAIDYRYKIRALLTRGRYSEFSNEVSWP